MSKPTTTQADVSPSAVESRDDARLIHEPVATCPEWCEVVHSESDEQPFIHTMRVSISPTPHPVTLEHSGETGIWIQASSLRELDSMPAAAARRLGSDLIAAASRLDDITADSSAVQDADHEEHVTVPKRLLADFLTLGQGVALGLSTERQFSQARADLRAAIAAQTDSNAGVVR